MAERSTSYLSRAVDEEFVAAEFGQSHRAPGVQTVCADADFSAKAELETIVEARRGVPEHGRAVDAGLEFLRGLFVGGDDGIAVRGAVAVDRGNGGFERIDDADRDDVVEKLGLVVCLGRGRGGNFIAGEDRGAGGIAAKLNVFCEQSAGE